MINKSKREKCRKTSRETKQDENIRTENVKPKSNLRSNESAERNSERKPDYLDRLERLEDEEQFELDSMMTVFTPAISA